MSDHIPFFNALQELHLSDREKRSIRGQIQSKRNKTLLLKKVFYYSKITGYTAVTAFAVFLFASSIIPQQEQWSISSFSDSIVTLRANNTAGIVQADTIGRLLEIQGVVQVIQDGKTLTKADISAGDLVVVQPGAQLIVQIREHTFAKIIGPAKFILENGASSNNYILNILEGETVEVRTEKTEETNQAASVQEETVIVKTKYLEVTSSSKEASTFSIAQVDTSATVTSTVGNVVVKQLMNDSANQELFVHAGNALHIDEKQAAIIQTKEQLAVITEDSKSLRIRYERSEENASESPSNENTTAVEMIDDNKDTIEKHSPSITEKIGKTKEVFTPELLAALQQTLHSDISKHNLASMKKELEENSSNGFVIAYGNLLEQVHRAYTLLDIQQPSISPSTETIAAGIQVTQTLLDTLQNRYFVPPSLEVSINNIINGLQKLQHISKKQEVPTISDGSGGVTSGTSTTDDAIAE